MYNMEAVQAWLAMQDAEASEEAKLPIINVQRNRCGGCGKFLPKDLTEESYVLVREQPYHMNEKCLTTAVTKIRASMPHWNWPMKEDKDES